MGKYYICEKKKLISDGKQMKVLVLKPTKNKKSKEKTPCILWIHGGGYRTGMAEMIYMSRAISLVKKYGAVVVTPEYRLSHVAPYPAALEDCYATLKYIKEHEKELGINPSQIMVGGESAGGGMTVALCMYARDKGEVNIAFQMPLYPMLDDRTGTELVTDNDAPVWNSKMNQAAWKMLLWGIGKGEEVPEYAAPARAKDLSNLPPMCTFVGSLEPFLEETLTYARRLKEHGIKVYIRVYKGCFHAFDINCYPTKVAKNARDYVMNVYRYAQKHYFAEQKREEVQI